MENLIFLLTASLTWYKSSRKFQRTFIGKGRSSFHFAPGAEFEHTANGGDELYFCEHQEKHITYGALIADLDEYLGYDDAETILHTYMNRLRKPFKAPYNTGITSAGTCQIELVDYWQDEDMVDWKVKAYSNGQTMAILYVKNINDAEVSKQEDFLESFRFGNG